MGRPFRTGHLRRALEHILRFSGPAWITRPLEIARYFRTLPADKQLIGA